MLMPRAGRSADAVADDLDALAATDRDFRGGRTFGLVYHARHDVEAVVAAAHDRFVWHNALNPDAFPSLRAMTADVVSTTAWLLSGGAVGEEGAVDGEPAGFLTSGGTESLLMAVKAAKVHERRERGITRPNIVVPLSAHAAFDKAGDYFGVEVRRVDVAPDFRADVDAMADACDDSTVLMVGSAPQFPQGVIDPIPELATIALDRGVGCHVDACFGGFVLPFLEVANLVQRPWDFRLPGVTSISADAHKYGYAPKGISVIVHRSKERRRDQTFVFDGWLGGFYASPGIQGARPGGPIAAAWAAMQYLGVIGFVELSMLAFRAREQLAAGISAIGGLTVLGEPDVTCLAITAAPDDATAPDVFAVADDLGELGWHLDRQHPPEALHLTCSPVHGDNDGAVVDELLADLRHVLVQLGDGHTTDHTTRYASLE
ncbi:MAG: pyridoxal phosphate-dependent decarboxylase family protein [Acidimicrobiales bacterium]